MKFKKYKLAEIDKKLRVSVHKTGKIGFTYEAAAKLKLSVLTSVDIATNEEDPSDSSLYLLVYGNKEEGEFKIAKAGHYYYVNIKVLLESLKIDYTNGNVSFEMEQVEYPDMTVYRLTRKDRELKDGSFLNRDDLGLKE